jgi:hypothetical protein
MDRETEETDDQTRQSQADILRGIQHEQQRFRIQYSMFAADVPQSRTGQRAAAKVRMKIALAPYFEILN